MKKIMTNIKTLAALLMAGAALTACSSEDNFMNDQPANPTEPQVYTMTIEATKGDAAATRGLSLDETKHKLTPTWNESEEVVVVQTVGTTNTTLGTLKAKASTDGITALTGELVGLQTGAQLKFYLHGASYDYTGQKGVLLKADGNNSIEEKYDYAFAATNDYTIDGSNVTVPSGINLEAQQSIVKFTLVDDSDNPVNVTSLKIDTKNPIIETINNIAPTGNTQVSKSMTITPTSGTNVIYAAISITEPYTDRPNDYTLTATDGNGKKYSYAKSGITFVNGKYYEVKVKMKNLPTDLSMVDCAGDTRDKRWTANCYMVHTAGNYILPLVYGNAIKDGETNAAAYTGIESGNTTTTFPRHDDNVIKAPWIKDNDIKVASAELLWQDVQGLVTKVGISGDYLTLTVGKDADAQEGNAVVAAKDGDGKIVWSWHIWVTKQTFAELTTISTGNHDYKVTPVNLGWVGDAKSATGYNTYYQWGRKDAFIPSTGTGNTNHAVYNINGETVTGLTFSNADASIGDNIKNPMRFYHSFYTDGPTNTLFYNMWDAQQTSDGGNIKTATVKTVYDPCPAGFCVPTSNLYQYMESVSEANFLWSDEYKGRILTVASPNLFFPASGYRYYSNSSLNNVGSSGYYWSASPYYYSGSNQYGRSFYFYSGYKYFYHNNRSYGFSVRAVAEE